VDTTGNVYLLAEVKLTGGIFEQGIVEIHPTTCAERVVASGNLLEDTRAIAVESLAHIAVAVDVCTNCPARGSVIRVNKQTGEQSVVSSGDLLISPGGISVGPRGFFYLATQINDPTKNLPGGIVRIHPSTGLQELMAFGYEPDVPPRDRMQINSPNDITVDTDGTMYVFDIVVNGSDLVDTTRLIRVDSQTREQTILETFFGIDRSLTSFSLRGIDIFGGVVYLVDYDFETNYGEVARFDPGAMPAVGQDLTNRDFWQPSGLAIVQVPEPAGLWLGLTAIAALGCIAQRRGSQRPDRPSSSPRSSGT
jgi:hypothetical protein